LVAHRHVPTRFVASLPATATGHTDTTIGSNSFSHAPDGVLLTTIKLNGMPWQARGERSDFHICRNSADGWSANT